MSLAKGFCRGEVPAKLLAKFGGSFWRSFRACFAGTFRAKKNFSKNFSPKVPRLCAAKLAKIQEKNFMTRLCRGNYRHQVFSDFQDDEKGGVEFKGGSRNRTQPPQPPKPSKPSRLSLSEVSKRGWREGGQNRQNRHEGYPP